MEKTPVNFKLGVRIAANGQEAMHVHKCGEADHEWLCNSSYCGSMRRNCPDHGGPHPRHDEGES